MVVFYRILLNIDHDPRERRGNNGGSLRGKSYLVQLGHSFLISVGLLEHEDGTREEEPMSIRPYEITT